MSSMLASDANNPQFVGAHNPDAALVVKFHRVPVLQPFESNLQGRPIFKDVDFVEIFTPGNQLNIIDTPVREEHKRRFPQQWANYIASHGTDSGVVGTAVSAWPFLTASQAEEFKSMKFFTVEQIANASDMQLQTLGMVGGANPHVIRERAKAYLAAASGTAAPQAQAAELAQAKEQLAAMQAQINALLAAQSGLTPAEPPKKKRGRRSKAEIEAAQAAVQEAAPEPEPQIQSEPVRVI